MAQMFIVATSKGGDLTELVYGCFDGIAPGDTFERDQLMSGSRDWTCRKVFDPESQAQLEALATLMGHGHLENLFTIIG